MKAKTRSKKVEMLRHSESKRKNIPTAELQSYLREDEAAPKPMRYSRNPDLDPQLVWRGKDEQDGDDLIVDTVPIYIQEKLQPKAIIEDLRRISKGRVEPQADLFADFNGLPDEEAKLEFYEHNANWSNRIILGDSLLVMNSLAEKEGLKDQVQMIYVDPPYGIAFRSNWQASTGRTDVKDGNVAFASREPEVIKAFRDTWSLGIHSYLSYLRDRLIVARELLSDSGSIFMQIGDENVHLVRTLFDEIYGRENFVGLICFRKKTMPFGTNFVEQMADFIIWYAKKKNDGGGRPFAKYRKLFREMEYGAESGFPFVQTPDGEIMKYTDARLSQLDISECRIAGSKSLEPSGPMESGMFNYTFRGQTFSHPNNGYGTTFNGMARLDAAGRLIPAGNLLRYALLAEDKSWGNLTVPWFDTVGADDKRYVVQTNTEVVKRCLLMTTDPGDLVLDPTCGSGTTAYVAEQWGRRWITIDTSRVALALARTRIMAARFPYYILKDSPEGQQKEAEITGRPRPEEKHGDDIRMGFVYERTPHITLKSIANNAEIDVIYERWQEELESLRAQLNNFLGQCWAGWEIPRQAEESWREEIKNLHAQWWERRRKRQEEIDAAIARNADVEFLYDQPYVTKNVVRVTGPFTVESLSPHRVLPTDEDDEMLEALEQEAAEEGRPLPPRTRKPVEAGEADFVGVVLENLKAAGVHNTKKNEQLAFTSLKPWAGGSYIHAEGRYMEGEKERRAAICVGPEYGTVSYQLVRSAAREAVDLFDVLVVCGFAFEPQVGEDTMSLGRLSVLKAHMNQDLRMAEHLKKTGAGNLFVVFGEPEIEIRDSEDGQLQVEIKGIDVFDPTTGEVRSGSTDDIACWFIDTDYNEESFFVRHAYFLGAKDPYEKLKRTLKAEIDEEAWATLNRDVSRPFPKPESGKIAVKVINHYGDEVLKVYSV